MKKNTRIQSLFFKNYSLYKELNIEIEIKKEK